MLRYVLCIQVSSEQNLVDTCTKEESVLNTQLKSSWLRYSIYSQKVHGLELKLPYTAVSLIGINLRQGNTTQIVQLNKRNSPLNGKKKQSNFGTGVPTQFKSTGLHEILGFLNLDFLVTFNFISFFHR